MSISLPIALAHFARFGLSLMGSDGEPDHNLAEALDTQGIAHVQVLDGLDDDNDNDSLTNTFAKSVHTFEGDFLNLGVDDNGDSPTVDDDAHSFSVDRPIGGTSGPN